MTREEISLRLDAIRNEDSETAHKLEDELYIDFIKYVASSFDLTLSDKAKHVLKAQEIEFDRWYA